MMYSSHATFQPLSDRRRSISDILPEIDRKSDLPKSRWPAIVSWIAVVVFIGVQLRLEHQPVPDMFSRNHPGYVTAPLYRWAGFHRVAP